MSLYRPVKIGNLQLDGNLFLAPVAGYSDRAFRNICVRGGANFCYTEMVSMEALTRGSDKTAGLMRRAPNEKAYAVQIFGGNPEVMEKGAKMVLEATNCELIDINCGCPVPKIIKSGAGSELTRNPEKLYKIAAAVVKAVEGKVPVTVKIRSGWDAQNLTWKEAADAAIQAGCKAITIHPRTRAQGYEGKADWSILADLVKFADGRLPIFGSGDAFSPQEAKAMLEETACSAVMFARGAMGRPFIFRQSRQLLETGSFDEIPPKESIQAGFDELDLLSADIGEKAACLEMRKRFCAYSKGVPGGGALRKEIVQSSSRADYQKTFAPILNS
ncbi:MAG: tRNA dihydrouridine synthase DusB [Treponema sp.]|nr:tRNA dihydrouridine synthase DusB [Treponema sp.]